MTTIVRITIILVVITHISSINEYNINDGDPIFLKYTSRDLNDTIIKSDMKFNLSLSRIIGTLLYAIDSVQNQLILSLYGNINERLKIEFRGGEEYIYLKQLCGCSRCRYQWLSLNIKIENTIRIKCNQEKFHEFPYNEKKQKSTDYPALNQSEKFALYFINTPKHEKGFPNNEQLQGCIKDILLNDKSIDLKPFPRVLPKCESSCANNVCNSGKCHETFSKKVICDCGETFLNGKYCNSSMLNCKTSVKNLKKLKLKLIKLTWKSNSVNILNITYRNFNFSIKYDGSSLIALYSERNEVIKGTLPILGNKSTNSLLFISFYDTLVNCKFKNSNRNVSGEFAVPRDISKEYITSLKLLDKDGEIDIVYKNDLLEYTWNAILDDVSLNCENETKIDINPDITDILIKNDEGTPNWKYIFLSIEVVIIIISIIMWIFILRKNRKNQNEREKSTEQILLNLLENREKCV